jgi:transglutaminase-like putative cysteine protease
MLIRAGYDIQYNSPQFTPMQLLISVHPSRSADLTTQGPIVMSPPVPTSHFVDGFGNVCTRLTTPPGPISISTSFVIQDSGLPDEVNWNAHQHPVEEVPDEFLVFLLGSRYCETDRLSDAAWAMFGQTTPGWARVQAICDFVHNRIKFGYENARPTRTAWEAYQEGVGVCRDYAHLAVTLCRCMNIPARYCTGYLGDIGVPLANAPMDFSAWFDVYLGGRWYTFDARHNTPRIGRILMARGRDATDVAISTAFGPAELAGFTVICDEIPG